MSGPGTPREGLPQPRITPANLAYFEGTAQGELRYRECPDCTARFRFIAEWCPECWSTKPDWKVASGRATVTHFTIVHQAPDESFATPYVLALVDLAEGVRMMTNIVGCEPDEVHIGMPVKVSFVPRGEVTLPMFVPVGGAEG